MRCPICGAKLYQKIICPYCNVTADDVRAASNKKVKEYRKSGRKDLIHFTNVLPQDVSRVKLWLFTIFLGWCGVNHFIVGRYIRGTFSASAVGCSITMFILNFIFHPITTFGIVLLKVIYELSFYSMAINIILWASDIIGLLTKSFKVPVVLPEKEKKRKNG